MSKCYKGILAIDFDDTIAVTEYPNIKGMVTGAKKYINKLYNDGWYIIIWTCRTDENAPHVPFTKAKEYLEEKGICYHQMNEHHPLLVTTFGNNSRKIAADFYIDDKNIFGLPAWSKIYNHLVGLPKSFKSSLRYCEGV